MKANINLFVAIFFIVSLVSCNENKTQLNKGVSTLLTNRSAGNALETQSQEAEARLKAARLYQALTGVNLLEGNPLKSDIENLVFQGRMKDAAAKITHRYNGAKAFYNNVVKNFGLPFNRTHSVEEDISDITALFIGVTRDDGTIDDLLYGNFYYYDPNINTPGSGTPNQGAYPARSHYNFLEAKGSFRDELVRETKGSGDIGLFTTHAWARAYYDMGTSRRPWKGVVEHLFCQEHPNIKTIYIPDDFVRRDVPREAGGVTEAFQTDCKGCHAQMDPISNGFQMFDWDTERQVIRKKDSFSEKINNPEVFPAGFIPATDDWWIYTTDSQEQLLGFRDVAADGNGPAISFIQVSNGLKLATGRGLKDLARAIAFSKGFARCLSERIVLQLIYGKVWSLATLSEEDKKALEADKALIDEIANELLTTRKIRRAFESVAIKFAERK